MTALAYFHCRPNSHPFQDRQLSLKDPVKIGRSVARCRPSPNNAVFDCKVLSRNHALLWYENGKFFLQDTRSSNGTFVNNQRLSKASEESGPVEVNSCDIVQFGVDVVDNTKKVTHGCIVSQLRLYLPNGDEAKQSNHAWNNQLIDKVPYNNAYPLVQSQDLYQLHQYLQEALHREQMLEQKLALLQRLVVRSHDASEKGWQALIDEDRLLSRLEFLENQLQTFNKTQDENSLQTKLQKIQEEKYVYENTSKETLRLALQEKLEAVRKVASLERSLSNTEDECTHLRQMHEQLQNQLTELATSHQGKIKEIEEISDKLQATEKKNKETLSELESNRDEIQSRVDDLILEKAEMSELLQASQRENEEFQKLGIEQPSNSEKDSIQEKQEDTSDKVDSEKMDEKVNEEEPSNNAETVSEQKDLNHNLQEMDGQEATESNKLEDENGHGEELQETLLKDQSKDVQDISEVALLRQKLESNEKEMDKRLYDVTQELQGQLSGVQSDLETKIKVIEELKEQIVSMESQCQELENVHLMEIESRKKVENEMLKFQEEKEKQTIELNEASRELQAALSAREILLEREERVRMEVEESERMLTICSSSESENDDNEDKPDVTAPAFTIFRAKLKEVKDQLKNRDRDLKNSVEESLNLKDKIKEMEKQIESEQEKLKEMEEKMKIQEEIKTPQVVEDNLQTSSPEEDLRNNLKMKEEELDEQRARIAEMERIISVKDEDVGMMRMDHEEQRRKLEEGRKLLEEEIASQKIVIEKLEGDLQAVRKTSEIVPQLQSDVTMLNATVEELRASRDQLSEELASSQKILQESASEFMTLKGNEESAKVKISDLEVKFNSVQEEMLVKDESLVELEREGKQLKDELEAAQEDILKKKELLAKSEARVVECHEENCRMRGALDDINKQLKEAQREKEDIEKELKRIAESTSAREKSLEEEITLNKSLLEESKVEKQKLTSAVDVKDEELNQVTTRCQQLIRERDSAARRQQRANVVLYLGMLIVILAVVISYLLAT